ncbi:MAG: hypothetical protein CV081_03030 [Nitrospira sp. LK265]|nr:hypothetical protein [Nitrospira sp. LK265]
MYVSRAGFTCSDTTSLKPASPFENNQLFPALIPSLGNLFINCALASRADRKSTTIIFYVSPLSGKKVIKQPGVFLLRDR